MENTTVFISDSSLIDHKAAVVLLIFLSLVSLITISANIIVILAFFVEPRLREPFNYFLLNLAISDLLIGTGGMTIFTLYTYQRTWPFSYENCALWLLLGWLGTTESIYTVAVIAADRLWAVMRPLPYRAFNTKKKALITVIVSWLGVLTLILPYLGFNLLSKRNKLETFMCGRGPVWDGLKYVMPMVHWMPLVFVLFCYTATAIKIWKRAKRRRLRHVKFGNSRKMFASFRRRQHLKERQSFVLLSLLSVVLVVCCLPWLVYSTLFIYREHFNLPSFFASVWVGFCMVLFNPFLFNIANPTMRRTIARMLTVLFRTQCLDVSRTRFLYSRPLLSRCQLTET